MAHFVEHRQDIGP